MHEMQVVFDRAAHVPRAGTALHAAENAVCIRARLQSPILLVFGFCFAVIRVAIRLGWNGSVISGLVGGSVSMVAVACFIMAEHLAPFIITIEPDVVSFQRSFQGIPVGTKKIYSRLLIRVLGVYLVEDRTVPRSFKWGRLCLWADGRSIQLENFFPISEGASLARDLRKMGIEFPRTFEMYDENHLGFAKGDDYLSF